MDCEAIQNMKAVFSFKLSLALVILLFALFSSAFTVVFTNVVADSTSFSRQELGDDEYDGIKVDGIAHNQTRDDYNGPLDASTDIRKISYLSDGQNLNATLWLGGNFTKDPGVKGAQAMVYGILLDVDSNPETGFQGVDYQLEVQWMNSSKVWNMFLGEYPSVDNPSTKDPADYLKLITVKRNYTSAFVDNKPYVTLSLPLKDIAFPNNFKAMYYATVIYNFSRMVIDLGTWMDIPPLDLTISTLPSPVVIMQGEQKNVAVQLKSNDRFTPAASTLLPMENYSKIDVQPNNVVTQLNGSQSVQPSTGPTTFKIKASSDAEIGEYTIPILVNISTGSVFPSEFLRLANFSFSVPTKGNTVRVANLTVSVTEPLTAQEQIKDFWSAYGGIITLVGAGFGGALATYVLDKVKTKKNNSNGHG